MGTATRGPITSCREAARPEPPPRAHQLPARADRSSRRRAAGRQTRDRTALEPQKAVRRPGEASSPSHPRGRGAALSRSSVPASPPPSGGTPSSNPEGLSGVVRRARTYCGWRTTGQESLPPSRRTRVTIGLPTRLFSQDPPVAQVPFFQLVVLSCQLFLVFLFSPL